MKDQLIELAALFCKHGGRFENMTIGYRKESGCYCSVIDSYRNATLLVDVDDIDIREADTFYSGRGYL